MAPAFRERPGGFWRESPEERLATSEGRRAPHYAVAAAQKAMGADLRRF